VEGNWALGRAASKGSCPRTEYEIHQDKLEAKKSMNVQPYLIYFPREKRARARTKKDKPALEWNNYRKTQIS
jgi:hypothetical protein